MKLVSRYKLAYEVMGEEGPDQRLKILPKEPL